jgi:hypothetical protein
VNERILAANNNNPAYRFEKMPDPDTNNWMPRIGFNWNPRTSGKGLVGFITGGEKLVLRGGYARAYDAPFVNINQNIFLAFPFTAPHNTAGNNAFTNTINITVPNIPNPATANRGAAAEDFRAPATDQYSLDIQRELGPTWSFASAIYARVGRGFCSPSTEIRAGPARSAQGRGIVTRPGLTGIPVLILMD